MLPLHQSTPWHEEPGWTTASLILKITDDSVKLWGELGTLVLRRARVISVYMLVIDEVVRMVERWMVEMIGRLLVQVTN